MKFTFKPFKNQKETHADPNGAEETQTPHQRRREQVRRAQKTHRERKEAYIKSLETEVIQLRANEARLFQETKALHAELSAMKTLLVANGISVLPGPPHSWENLEVHQGSEELFEFNISKKTKHKQERINVRRQIRHRGNTATGRIGEFAGDLSYSPSAAAPPTSKTTVYSPDETIVSQLDPTATGMDFILALEAPCLAHIPHNDLSSSSPSGHALMVSAAILHHHHPSTTGWNQDSSPIWNILESGVERLLQLSDNLPLDGEVTPVQAWDYIRQHPQYEALNMERLEKLKTTLMQHVKCYGFGGVIPQDIFENALFDTFVVGRVF